MGQTPLARWDGGWTGRSPVRKDEIVVAEAFRWSAIRTATRSATVSVQPNTYYVDQLLVGKRVELVYDRFELVGPITDSAGNDIPAGIAELSEIAGTCIRKPPRLPPIRRTPVEERRLRHQLPALGEVPA